MQLPQLISVTVSFVFSTISASLQDSESESEEMFCINFQTVIGNHCTHVKLLQEIGNNVKRRNSGTRRNWVRVQVAVIC